MKTFHITFLAEVWAKDEAEVEAIVEKFAKLHNSDEELSGLIDEVYCEEIDDDGSDHEEHYY